MSGLTRELLRRLLGYPEGMEALVSASRGPFRELAGVRVAEVALTTASSEFSALHLAPLGVPETGKSVIYCHAHGSRYEIGKSEVVDGRPTLLSPPPGLALAAAGHHVLAADMVLFGDRRSELGEAGEAKAALWQGQALLGRMLADLGALVDCALADPAIPSDRLVSFGMSMGATLAYWLAALDERLAGVAHLCAFSDIAPLIATGAHDLHGPYMTVPGFLRHGDMGDVAALIAPRPQLVASGDSDPLTPDAAWAPALARVAARYEARGARDALWVLRQVGAGHAETPEMRAALMDFMERV